MLSQSAISAGVIKLLCCISYFVTLNVDKVWALHLCGLSRYVRTEESNQQVSHVSDWKKIIVVDRPLCAYITVPCSGHLGPLLLIWFDNPGMISNCFYYKLRNDISWPFPNFHYATVEVWIWMKNFIPHFNVHVKHSSMLGFMSSHVNQRTSGNLFYTNSDRFSLNWAYSIDNDLIIRGWDIEVRAWMSSYTPKGKHIWKK